MSGTKLTPNRAALLGYVTPVLETIIGPSTIDCWLTLWTVYGIKFGIGHCRFFHLVLVNFFFFLLCLFFILP